MMDVNLAITVVMTHLVECFGTEVLIPQTEVATSFTLILNGDLGAIHKRGHVIKPFTNSIPGIAA